MPIKSKNIIQANKRNSNSLHSDKSKPVEKWTLSLSIIAIIISGMSVFFQFFYEKHYTTAHVFDSDFKDDTTLNVKVLYHNKGNQDATVLFSNIIFSSKSIKDIHRDGISFNDKEATLSHSDKFSPVTISPAKQVLKEINQPFDFSRIDLRSFNIRNTDTIQVFLSVGFINSFGYYSVLDNNLGWLTLDSANKLNFWSMDNKILELDSQEYYTKSSVSPASIGPKGN